MELVIGSTAKYIDCRGYKVMVR